MSILRLYSPIQLRANTEHVLGSDQARYVGRVLRLRPGDELTVFDGSKGEFLATIQTVTKQELRLSIGEHASRHTESPLRIRLLQGLSRGEKMDFVVQKATELGVHRISAVLTEFSVVKLDPDRAARRTAHWVRIAASACEQCGRNEMPLIDAPQLLHKVLASSDSQVELRLVLDPAAEKPLPSIERPSGPVTILIGPEGGLGDNEKEQARAAGFAAVSFGPRILRTETAALAAISTLQALFGDLGGSQRRQARSDL